MPPEISEMEGLKKKSAVRQLIIRVSDKLRAGEIRVIDATLEESAKAKSRLNSYRDRKRQEHNARTKAGS